MANPKTRTGTCKFSDSVDIEAADAFIRKWEKLSIYIGLKEGFERRLCRDRHTFISGALEGAYRTYVILSKMQKPPWDDRLVRTVLRRLVRRCIYDMAIINGYLRSSGQIFFPTRWMRWEDYFSVYSTPTTAAQACDLASIYNLIDSLPEKDSKIMQLFADGYDCAYISNACGFRSRSAGLKRVYKSLALIRNKLQI